MANVLLTRSKNENELATKKLSLLGFKTISLPILSYQDLPFELTETYKHIIITSKYAARLASKNINHPVECWAIGKESAAILANNPNIAITGVAKNLQELLGIISLIPEDEASDFFNQTIYLSGDIITKELPSYIKKQVVYKVSYLEEVEPLLLEKIKAEPIKYTLVYSKNCGINLIRLINKHNLLPYVKDSALIAISKEVSDLFNNFFLQRMHSSEPTFEHMIKLLKYEE